MSDETKTSPLDSSEANAKLISNLTSNGVFSLTDIIDYQEARSLALERTLALDRGWTWLVKMQDDELLLRASILRKREDTIKSAFQSLVKSIFGSQDEDEKGVKDRVRGMTQ